MRKSATQEPSHLIFTPEEKEGRAGEDRLSGIAQKTALGTTLVGSCCLLAHVLCPRCVVFTALKVLALIYLMG